MRLWPVIIGTALGSLALAACGARDFPGTDGDDLDAARPTRPRDAGPSSPADAAPRPGDGGEDTPLLFVDLLHPPDGATLGEDFDVFARPNRTDGVVVRFWLDDVMLGLADAPPYSIRVVVADHAEGPHTLRVVARDEAGTRVEDAVRVTFGREIGPPSVRFVTPQNGEVVTGPIDVLVATSGGVGGVRFEVDGLDLGRFRDGRFAWTPEYLHAPRVLRAVADGAEDAIRVEVDHPLQLELTRCVFGACGPPADGESISGDLELSLAVVDDEPHDVFRGALYLDEAFVDELGFLPSAWIWDTDTLGPGEHHVRIELFTRDGRAHEAHWRFRVPGEGEDELAPAAYVSWVDIPPDAAAAVQRGCTVFGHNRGSGLGSLVGLVGRGYAEAVQPGADGLIPHVILGHIAGWPPGTPGDRLRRIDLRLLRGVHEASGFLIDRASFPDRDPRRPPRVRYADTPVDRGVFRTERIALGIGLPPVVGWRPIYLTGATVRGELYDGMDGFGIGGGLFEGFWTEGEVLTTLAALQADCAEAGAPSECDLWSGILPPNGDPLDALPLLLGLIGGYDIRWENGGARECDPARQGDCNAVSVCVPFEASEARIAGIAP